MMRWWQRLTPERLLRIHFLASPFGAAVATYLVTYYATGCNWPSITDDFDNLAKYASISAILYGALAVASELIVIWGGKAVLYGIATLVRTWHEMKKSQRGDAVRIVSQENTLTADAIRSNATLQANPQLVQQVLAELECEPIDEGN